MLEAFKIIFRDKIYRRATGTDREKNMKIQKGLNTKYLF